MKACVLYFVKVKWNKWHYISVWAFINVWWLGVTCKMLFIKRNARFCLQWGKWFGKDAYMIEIWCKHAKTLLNCVMYKSDWHKYIGIQICFVKQSEILNEMWKKELIVKVFWYCWQLRKFCILIDVLNNGVNEVAHDYVRVLKKVAHCIYVRVIGKLWKWK